MTEFMALAEKVSKFNQEAMKHLERQTLNPFSGRFSRSPSPRPKFSKEEYGKPAAGSKTELRGQRAYTQISREILELCEVIHDMGTRRRDPDGDECIIIPFGELFAFYTKISDKVVGLLIAAKKRGFVYFEPEILFQRRDDDVLIALLKPMGEIRNIINRQISASPSPAPPAPEAEKPSSSTPSPLAQQDNPPAEASSTEKSEPSQTPETSEKEPTASSVENPPQDSSATGAAETPQTSTTLGQLLPVEEEVSSSEAPVVNSKPEPTPDTTEALQTTSTIVEEHTITDKENTETKESAATDEQQTVPTTTTSEEAVPLTTTSQETVPPTTTSEEPIASATSEEPVAPTTTSEETVSPTTSEESASPTTSEETISPTTSEETVAPTTSEEQASEPSETTLPTEKILAVQPVADSEDQESLTLKIIVEVEPGQVPPSATVEPEVESSPAVAQDLDASEAQVLSPVEETSSSLSEVASGDAQTSSSVPTTEIEATLSTSDKSEVVTPADEEQTPPSNDTGEKTLA